MSFQLKRCFFKFHERLYHYRKHFKSNYGNILTVRYFSLPQPKQNHNRTNDDQNRGYAHQFWCRVRPYYYLARIDKSVGTMLLLWPCVWGTSLATEMGHVPDIILLSKFAVGAFVMRGAGCVINDLWDRDFDKHVERTKLRPLASGEVTVAEALVFLFGQLSCGLLILVSFNYSTIVWGFASMPLVIAYPLMKRFTNWPQLVLGLTFNWGVIVGWTAVQGSLSLLPVLPLYFSGVCWTLVYDTLYGYQDREDDKKLGLKSTSLYFGDQPQLPLTTITMLMTCGLMTTGMTANLTLPYYLIATASSGHMLWQIWTADINNRENLWQRFRSNNLTGAMIAMALIVGHF